MTDRYKGAVVVFERDIREDDAKCLLDALKMIKGVSSVSPSLSSMDDYMNRSRVRSEIMGKVYDALDPIFFPKEKE